MLDKISLNAINKETPCIFDSKSRWWSERTEKNMKNYHIRFWNTGCNK